MKWHRDAYVLTDEADAVDRDAVTQMLQTTYWAGHRPRDVIEKSIEGSLCFSLWVEKEQVGFARVVTDKATFAWIADVIIKPAHRGQGLGHWMMTCLLEHPAVVHTSRQLLRTDDAHALYTKLGFEAADCMTRSGLPVR